MNGTRSRVQAVPVIVALFAALLGVELHAQAVPGCGNLDNLMGPFDYTNPNHMRYLPIVETHHFQPEVERLEDSPKYGGPPGGGIDYTLRAFPNHHRALASMAQYELMTQQSPPPKSRYTADCWFQRAIAWRPDDGTVRRIYGAFLHMNGGMSDALQQYKDALRLGDDSPELHYNLGLLYCDRQEYGLAYDHAIVAYDAGFPLPGLKEKLKSAGHWGDE